MSNTSVDNVELQKHDIDDSLELIALKKKGKRNLRLNTTPLHIMLLPAVLLTLIYAYSPMLGVVIALKCKLVLPSIILVRLNNRLTSIFE